jgi:excisionase family DNA binding protein
MITKTAIRFYTIAQIADFLAVSARSVRRWIVAGDLFAYKFGRQVRISENDLRVFLERRLLCRPGHLLSRIDNTRQYISQISGKLPILRRSIYRKVVFPNIIPRPPVSSRDLSWQRQARKRKANDYEKNAVPHP